jgi:phosphatidylinositol-3-phosphatase
VKALLGVALAAFLAVACSESSATRQPIPKLEHVIVVVLENQNQGSVLGSDDAPHFNAYAKRYAVLSHYGGVAHPSLPNYLALVSGSTHGITTDCTTCLVSARNLADTLERAHLSWKTYAEGLPRPGFTGGWDTARRYAKKHVPFLYFRDVVSNPARLQRVVPLRQFSRDLAASALPSFSLIVPNLCHDMHDCPVETGDKWLGGFVSPLLRNPELSNSVIFVVTDEPSTAQATAAVPALALGPLVSSGSRYSRRTSHYGLLRTIEDAWGLPRLGHSAQVRPISGIWRQ